MNGNFNEEKNREMILDIIYDYLDVYETVESDKISTKKDGDAQ